MNNKNKKLYDLMNWPEIENIVYSDCRKPSDILGPHKVKEGLLIQAFFPEATAVSLVYRDKSVSLPMDMVDAGGFFAILLEETEQDDYYYQVTMPDNSAYIAEDVYRYSVAADEKGLERFEYGINYEVYRMLGAHLVTVDSMTGVRFAVWAPEAARVSVVGEFNRWDGRRHQMEMLGESGVYALFIPGIGSETLYKYEIRKKNGDVILKADPYAFYAELRPATASIVYDIDQYKWSDGEENWQAEHMAADEKEKPMLIYELHAGSFMRPEDDREFLNYRELAVSVAEHAKHMGYTHVELMPVMEHPLDASWGYQVTGYYAPTSRMGTPEDFMYFIDYMHQNDIGVILDWVPAHFPKDTFGLAQFDGSCLYEHKDPRQGEHPHWGTLIFNYGRPQVSNFLIANAMFWAEVYHVDGFRMDAVASMLYLDYGKKDGEWVANIYGGNQNLEAVEFLKHLNSMMRKRNPNVVMIAEESTAWPQVTKDAGEGALGFHYKWNMGWMNDFLEYMQLDPLYRNFHYNDLLFSMVYAYSEDYVLALSHDEVVHGKKTLIDKMPGTYEEKFSNLRLAYGYMAAHPGKKLLFMGQEFGQFAEFDESKSTEWFMLKYKMHEKLNSYVRDLNTLYRTHKAFYQKDFEPEGFEWLECNKPKESIVGIMRKTDDEAETCIIICNFTPVVREEYRIGVPFEGVYKEVFNSDQKKYGGQGYRNAKHMYSEDIACSEREQSITLTVPPLGITVLTWMPKKKGRR